MNADQLYDAIGEIGDDLILDAGRVPVRSRGRFARNLVAAAVMIFLLALPVSAEMRTGYISNLLAPLYGGAQTELVDSVGVPIDARTTVGGYTLSADAVIGDRYNLAIVYTLRREDGGELPEGLRFDSMSSVLRGGGGGWSSRELSEDRTAMTITQSWSSNSPIFLLSRKVEVSFTDLVTGSRDDDTLEIVQEGCWELTFTARYEDTTTTIRVDDLVVHNGDGDEFTVHKVRISPFGVNIKLTVPNANYGNTDLSDVKYPKIFDFALRLKDGSIIQVEGGAGSGGSWDKPTHKGNYHAMFDTPVPLEQIGALVLCDTELVLE